MENNADKKVLLMVTGTGIKKKEEDPSESKKRYKSLLCRVIKQSMESSAVDDVWLLTSQSGREIAEEVKSDLISTPIEMICLDDNMEFDADKCYHFFDKELKNIISRGYAPDNIIIDNTHGTKPMSAALYAIGMRYRIGCFQYTKRKKGENGKFIEEEEIAAFDASYAKWQATIDECRVLFQNWQFSAIKQLLQSLGKKPKNLKEQIERIEMLADFYGAWDRLNYEEALRNYPEFSAPEGFDNPPEGVRKMLEQASQTLAEPQDGSLSQANKEKNKQLMISLMFDLYANGLRRLASGQYEDAGIRVYRMAELLGQIYLLEEGYVSSCMPADNPDVKEIAGSKTNGNKSPYRFNRTQVIRFLDKKGIDVKVLNEMDEKVKIRNNSVLIHGFSGKMQDEKDLKELFEKIINKLPPFSGFQEIKKSALFMNSFKEKK